MDINEAFKYTQYLCGKDLNGMLTPVVFNSFCKEAQYQVALRRYKASSLYPVGDGTAQEPQSWFNPYNDDLLPLTVESTLTITSGYATLPSDYWHFIGLSTADGINIKKVDYRTFLIESQNEVTDGTEAYPLATFISGSVKFSGLTSAKLAYLKKTTTPYWNYTMLNGKSSYNPTGSTDFILPIDTHQEICAYIAFLFGTSISDQNIVNSAIRILSDTALYKDLKGGA